jgi:myo-inositol-1(or 4)-monophosphatase
MTEINIEFLAKVETIAKKVGEFQLLHWNKVKQESIEDKGLNQLVSFVDQQSEQQLVDSLSEILPNSTFIGEEKAPKNRTITEYTWIIDPLDGTTNFLHGLPLFSISIALLNEGTPILGVVYCPALHESFTALKNHGAFLNGERIKVAQNTHLKDTLIATGFPYYQFEKVDEYLKVLSQLMKSTHGLRRMGSAAIDLAYTACGRFDAFFEMNLSPWDIAAGILLVEEAGGTVSDFSEQGEVIFKNEIVASSKAIYGDFVKELQILV